MKEKNSKIIDKTQSRRNKKVVALIALTIGNVLTLSSITFAWFVASTKSASKIKTFSGDMDVQIQKVEALKYVYPYYNNSAEFIDYEGEGVVKSYVVEDISIEEPINISSTTTIALGTVTNQPYNVSSTALDISYNKIHYEESQDFKYYLIGDGTFNGVENNEWSTLTATPFSRREVPVSSAIPSDADSATRGDIVVSKGAEFILFDAHTINPSTTRCSYFSYGTPYVEEGKNSPFEIIDNNRIKCLKSGIYKFRYRKDSSGNDYLDITLTSRDDNAIIGSNLVDPTMITIDYRGSVDKSIYPTVESYLSTGIQKQMTTVVLDVSLAYQNKNDIDAGLRIERNAISDQSISSYDGKYATTDPDTYIGYVDDSHRNPFNGSDFYSFYSEIAKNENAYATHAEAWNAMHNRKTDSLIDATPAFDKFKNGTTFDTELPCTLHPTTNDDSSFVEGSITDNLYHIYIAIEYDYEYMRFFINQDRLGKTFLLDRDFRFYFSAVQHLEEAPSIDSGGEVVL